MDNLILPNTYMVQHVARTTLPSVGSSKIAGRRRVIRKPTHLPRPHLTNTNTNANNPGLMESLVRHLRQLNTVATPENREVIAHMLQQVKEEPTQTNKYPYRHAPIAPYVPKRIQRTGRSQHHQVKSRHTSQDRSHFKRNFCQS